MELHDRIKQCRQNVGLTQEQVAEAMNVSRQAVTKWENGKSAPSTENLFKLASLERQLISCCLSMKTGSWK